MSDARNLEGTGALLLEGGAFRALESYVTTAWTNRVIASAPGNGTATHTVDPSSVPNLVSGTPFTPTAGRFLLAIVEGSVTSSTPSGWTLPTNGSAINNSGLYIWYRTAVGGDTFTTTHNGSNYPFGCAIYEFPAGTTFVAAVSAANIGLSATNPTLSGLTGTNLVMGATGASDNLTGTPVSVIWVGGTQDFDINADKVPGIDGYHLSVVYQSGYTAATFAPTPTYNVSVPGSERLTWALNIP